MSHVADRAPTQGKQFDPSFRFIDQRPLLGAVITKPKMLDNSAMLACTDKGRRGRLPGRVDTLGFDQKQFSLTQSEEGFSTFRICTLAEHNVLWLLATHLRRAL
jgi:hypothetical protein